MRRVLQKFLSKEKLKEAGMTNRKKGKTAKSSNQVDKLKSPSDTTIYAPALAKQASPLNRTRQNPYLSQPFVTGNTNPVNNTINEELIFQFVEQVLMQSDIQRKGADTPHNTPELGARRNSADRTPTPGARMLTEMEQFKANVEPPKGTVDHDVNLETIPPQLLSSKQVAQIIKNLADNDDDDFFHLTCHVDVSLQNKISKGEFVDLERLLPKTRAQVVSDEQKMQFVNKDGASFWIPADRENRINGI